MIVFWVVAGLLSAAAASLILHRAAGAVSAGAADDPTLALYRRQLGEIDDLAERGLLAQGERAGAHAEAARRLLGAANAPAHWTLGPGSRLGLTVTAVVAPLAAIGLYLVVGSPGLPGQPFAARVEAWKHAAPETLGPSEMAAVLKTMTRERPRDPEAFRYLALAEAASDNPDGAIRALHRAIPLAPRRADLWEMLAEAQMALAGGEVTPAARQALEETLKRDPRSLLARFHLARAQIAAGDRAGGLAVWRGLMAGLPSADPRRAQLADAIAQVGAARDAGPALDAGQREAVAGMVAGLAARLEAAPDDPEGWVRLVRSYAVLGDLPARDAALVKARARYAGKPDVMTALDAAAAAAPLSAR